MHDFSFKIFCLTVPKNFVGTLRCIRKFRVAKNFMHERGGGGGGIKIFRRKFLSHSAENLSRGESFSVAIFSGIEKVWIREGGEYQDCPSKIFCLTVPKISVGESCTVAISSGIEKVWIRGGGGEYQDFP